MSVAQTTMPVSSSPQDLEQYLDHLQLDWLRLELRLQQLERAPDVASRRTLAADAMQLFENSMASGQWSSDHLASLLPRIESLRQAYPALSNEACNLAYSHALFVVREREFFESRSAPWDVARTTALQHEFARLSRLLDDVGVQLAESSRQLMLQSAPAGDIHHHRAFEALRRQLAQQVFVQGWVCYYCGILDPERRISWFHQAEAAFREFLDAGDREQLHQLPADWLRIETAWQCRALIGLAMTVSGLHRDADAKWCWQAVSNAPAGLVDPAERLVWELRGLSWTNRYADAVVHARLRLTESNEAAPQLAYWLSCMDAAADARRNGAADGDSLLTLATTGLLRAWELPLLSEHVERLGLRWGTQQVDFWLQGTLACQRAWTAPDQSAAARAIEEAIQSLTVALDMAEPDQDSQTASLIRLLLGMMARESGDWHRAAQLGDAVRREFSDTCPSLAAMAAWLNVEAQIQMAQSNPSQLADLWRAIDVLQAQFPGSSWAQRAALERVKLENQRLPPSEALTNLARVKISSVLEADIAVERLRQMHRAWLAEMAHGAEAAEPLLQLLLEQWRDLQNREATFPNAVRIATRLIVVDALLQHAAENAAHLAVAEAMLADAAQLASTLSIQSPLAAELKYQQMMLGQRNGDAAQALRHAEWLVEHAENTPLARSAFVVIAQTYDERLRATEQPSEALLQQACQAFMQVARASQQRGGSGSLTDPVGQVAARRLAECQTRLGNLVEASDWYDQLLAALPLDRDLLVAAGQVKMRLRRYDQAAPLWRRLIAGSTAGSELWLQGRYQLILCLFEEDRDAASALREQTLLLYPNMPGEWRERLTALPHRGSDDGK